MEEAQVNRQASGVVFVHAVPKQLRMHVEWAIADVLGARIAVLWNPQPVAPGLFQGTIVWHGAEGDGARLASALFGWAELRYEVTEIAGGAVAGYRWMYTPSLGAHTARIDEIGNVLLDENVLRDLIARAATDGADLSTLIDASLGSPWDEELEPFRNPEVGANVVLLHRAG